LIGDEIFVRFKRHEDVDAVDQKPLQGVDIQPTSGDHDFEKGGQFFLNTGTIFNRNFGIMFDIQIDNTYTLMFTCVLC
jgi:hypothetical protein